MLWVFLGYAIGLLTEEWQETTLRSLDTTNKDTLGIGFGNNFLVVIKNPKLSLSLSTIILLFKSISTSQNLDISIWRAA
jgi:hypothetical protein